MFTEVLKDLPALLFTFGSGFALLGLLVWVLAAQEAANRNWAFVCWGLAALLIVWGIMR